LTYADDREDAIPHSHNPRGFAGPLMATRIRSPRRQHHTPTPFRDLAKSLEQLLSWSDLGACRGSDPSVFFPERGMSTRNAKAICKGCDVADRCLEWAVTTNERFGVWGGKSEKERRAIRRKRGLLIPWTGGKPTRQTAGSAEATTG